ncbi:hypothetical protein IJT17_01535, partial [bacterium]|nr:hypothetical protein [bacterium]
MDTNQHEPQDISSASEPACSSTVTSQRRESIIVALSSILLLVLFLAPYLCTNSLIYSGDFGSSDLLELNIPRRILAAQAILQGRLPFWEAKLSNGLPLLAEGQAAVLNPFNTVPYLLFSPTLATNICILITLFIALAGTYWLIRQLGLHPLAALTGAAAFALGGVFVFRLRHLNLIHAIAYLPLILALMRGYLRALLYRMPVRYWLAGLLLTAVLQILTGHPQMTYLSWIIATIFAFSSLWGAPLDPPAENAAQPTKDSPLPPAKRSPQAFIALAIAQLSLMGIASALLCAIQLLPTYELSQLSARSEPYTWEALKSSPFTARDLQHLIRPYCYGNPALGTYARASASQGVFWEVTAYIGLVPLGLAVFSLFSLGGPRRRSIIWLCSLAVFFFIASLGPAGYIYGIFWKLCPGFNLFRCPSRFLFAFSLALALLSAFGCQHLLNALGRCCSTRKARAA